MPKYYQYQIAGYYLYYNSHCIIECMHVHTSDKRLTEGGSAKFFVNSDDSTVIQNRGILSDIEINKIRKFIKINYLEMFEKWCMDSDKGFLISSNFSLIGDSVFESPIFFPYIKPYASRKSCISCARSAARKTALPATSTVAPARIACAAVSRLMPPST